MQNEPYRPGAPRHRLSGIDAVARTAICRKCGPVAIKKAGVKADGSARWRCKVAARQWRGTRYKKRALRAMCGPVCERCGFVPEHARQMDVHHRDRDRLNNVPENLETLCANCHRLEHAV